MKHESYCETRESLAILSRTLDHSYRTENSKGFRE